MNIKNDTTLINEVLEKIPNKYLAVIVASKRARDINEGLSSAVKTGAKKPTTMALEEIASGIITPMPEKPKLKQPEQKEELMITSENSEDNEEDEENDE
ncbi:DNA-directed RNA polymerase subunit omega [Candidatus Poribacteria bacterium]|nr:DNA-directed RNA polymerase subunit omega [Candidatus Poribacteria bacterium]